MTRGLPSVVPLLLIALATGCNPATPSGAGDPHRGTVDPAVPGLPPPPVEVLRAQQDLVLPEGFVRDPAGRLHCRSDGAEAVLVSAGEFTMGTDGERFAVCYATYDGPRHRVSLDAFLVDRTPVTLGQWRRFLAATGSAEGTRSSPADAAADEGGDRMPVAVTFHEARRYAAWAGKSLPTEAQWEKAARGTDGRFLPWGDEERDLPDEPLPAGALPANASPFGVLGIAGGPSEWCLDPCGPSPDDPGVISRYPAVPVRVEPAGPTSGKWRIVRNGYFENSSSTPRGIFVRGVIDLPLYESTRNWRRPMDSSRRGWSPEDVPQAFRCVRRVGR